MLEKHGIVGCCLKCGGPIYGPDSVENASSRLANVTHYTCHCRYNEPERGIGIGGAMVFFTAVFAVLGLITLARWW